MPVTNPGPVVVGVELPTHSATATAYGAMEAVRHHVPLVLVHVVEPTIVASPIEEWIASAEVTLDGTALALRAHHPDLDVTTKVLAGSPGPELVRAVEDASLLVVGSRGTGGFPELLLGSVAHQVTTRATVPVIVVRHDGFESGADQPADAGPVLVAVDAADEASIPLDFAFREAAARGVSLVAVNAWPTLGSAGLAHAKLWSIDTGTWQREMESDSEAILAAALTGITGKYPDVTVKQMIVHGDSTARTLLDTADEVEAVLIVVGSKGVHGMARVLLGSFAQQVVHHAHRPVAVVPHHG
jgi:nucleotide-binding universal stress UspA family protein